jgi:hypothetical protein
MIAAAAHPPDTARAIGCCDHVADGHSFDRALASRRGDQGAIQDADDAISVLDI